MRRLDRFLDPLIAVVAAGLALGSLFAADVDAIDPRLREPDLFAAVATAVAAGALAWRRSRPVASYAVFVAGAVVVSGSFHNVGLLSVLMLFSLFSLATYGTRREGIIGLGVGIAVFLALGLAGVPDLRMKDLLLAVALLVASWAVAEALRSRREQQHDRVRAAVSEERLRIARELHDVVAHSMSLIAVQAGVGAHVIRTDPAAAEHSLGVIADTSRKALEQTRSMLGMLREQNEDGTRPPTQGLDDLATLVEDVLGRRAHRRALAGRGRRRPGGLAGGVPDRAGVPHQRHQALDGVDGHGRRLPSRGPARAGDRRPRTVSHLLRASRPRPGRPRRARAAGRGSTDPRRPRRGVRRACLAAGQGRPMIRVAVVDDQDLVRAGFVLLLGSAPDVEVVGEARDGLEAIALCRRTSPDVVLMDVRMPHLDGLAATRTILADPACQDTRILVLTTFEEDDLVIEALRVGGEWVPGQGHPPRPAARGHRGRRRRRGAAASARHASADRAVRGAAGRAVLERRRQPHRTRARRAPRRLQGLSNQEIAASLHLGYGTVKTHVSHLLTKLGFRDRAQLVMYAYESGVAVPGRG